jgi:AcrR family transcriptional regulator
MVVRKNGKAFMTRGRPRSFDCDEVLDRAMEVFWRKGYEGTSISDLTAAMGINPPSLYAAFGNKEALFRKALDRYVAGRTSYWVTALEEPTARETVERLLRDGAELLTSECHRGCMMVKGALTCGDESGTLQREMASRRAQGETSLRQRFERAMTEGDLPPDTDPASLARYVMAITQGMAIQAEGGASRKELEQIVDVALCAFPSAPISRKSKRAASGRSR